MSLKISINFEIQPLIYFILFTSSILSFNLFFPLLVPFQLVVFLIMVILLTFNLITTTNHFLTIIATENLFIFIPKCHNINLYIILKEYELKNIISFLSFFCQQDVILLSGTLDQERAMNFHQDKRAHLYDHQLLI